MDWDGTASGGKGSVRQRLADVAAWVIENMDRSINEQYLWCATTRTALDQIMEGGLEQLMLPPEHQDVVDAGAPLLHLFETANECISPSALEPKEDNDNSMQALLLCRVLCGQVHTSTSTEDTLACR